MAPALIMRAQMLSEAGRGEDATRDLRRALEIEPDHPGVVIPNALEMEENGRSEASLALLRSALARQPGQEELLWYTSLVELRQERIDSAIQTLTRLEEHSLLSGSGFQVRSAVALSAARTGTDSAQGSADLFRAIGRSLPMTLDACAMLMRFGFEKPLRTAAALCAEQHQGELEVGFLNASLLQSTGFSDQAIAEVERLLLMEPGRSLATDLQLVAAAAEGDRMRFAGARERLREVLDADPTSIEALAMLVEAVLGGRGTQEDREDLARRITVAREKARTPRTLAMLEQLEAALSAAAQR